MPLLPRPELGEWDGVWQFRGPYTDLRVMIRDMQEAVKETGERLEVAINVKQRTVGFAMHQHDVEDGKEVVRTWVFEMDAQVYQNELWRTPKLRGVLPATIKNAELVKFANRLSEGETFF